MKVKKRFAFLHKPSNKFLMEDEGGMFMSDVPIMTFTKNDSQDYVEYIKECYMWDGDNMIITEEHPSKLSFDDIEIVEVEIKW